MKTENQGNGQKEIQTNDSQQTIAKNNKSNEKTNTRYQYTEY